MGIFIGIILSLLQLLFGMQMTSLWKEKKPSLPYLYVTGFFGILIIFELSALFCIMLSLPLLALTVLFSAILLLAGGLIAVLNGRRIRKIFTKKTVMALLTDFSDSGFCDRFLLILAWLLVFLQIAAVFKFMPDTQGDITMETVRTTLTTGTLFQYHPLTGNLLETKMSISGRIAALPLLYSFLCDVTGMDAATLLYKLVPLWTLALSYAVYGLWASCVGIRKRVFYVFYGFFMLYGDYLFTEASFRFFHGGFKGETIVSGIILPFLVYLFIRKKQPKKVSFAVALLAGIPLLQLRALLGYYGILILFMGASLAFLICLKLIKNKSGLIGRE